MSIRDNFAGHLASPHVSIDQHVRNRVVELGQSVESYIPIYLDTKFWILLRKADARKNTQALDSELLLLLRSLVRDGILVCPITESTFLELMKQEDMSSRMLTANLIDELSRGISLLPHEMRVATEIAHFFEGAQGHDIHPLHHLVWTKLSYVLGFSHPTSTGFDPQTELAIQKSFLDHMWNIPLCDMVHMIGKRTNQSPTFDDLAEDLNRGILEHAHEIRSFSRAYRAEAQGAAELCGDVAVDIFCCLYEKATGFPPPAMDSNQRQQTKRNLEHMLFLALNKSKNSTILPTVRIEAHLHALFRWDKQRRFSGNHIYDFHHASAGVAYCRALFTEHDLRSILVDKLSLDRVYDCRVISESSEALAFLKTIEQRRTSAA